VCCWRGNEVDCKHQDTTQHPTEHIHRPPRFAAASDAAIVPHHIADIIPGSRQQKHKQPSHAFVRVSPCTKTKRQRYEWREHCRSQFESLVPTTARLARAQSSKEKRGGAKHKAHTSKKRPRHCPPETVWSARLCRGVHNTRRPQSDTSPLVDAKGVLRSHQGLHPDDEAQSLLILHSSSQHAVGQASTGPRSSVCFEVAWLVESLSTQTPSNSSSRAFTQFQSVGTLLPDANMTSRAARKCQSAAAFTLVGLPLLPARRGGRGELEPLEQLGPSQNPCEVEGKWRLQGERASERIPWAGR
jgi:hypothetical protein